MRIAVKVVRRPGWFAVLVRRLIVVHGMATTWRIAAGRHRAGPLAPCTIAPRVPAKNGGAGGMAVVTLGGIAPMDTAARLEALAYSGDGSILAVASTERSEVLLYQRQADGHFAELPTRVLGGFLSGFGEPHGICFLRREGQEFMAVANRLGWISLHRRQHIGGCARRPTFIIAGPRTGLQDSDAVAAVPPLYDVLAVCNHTPGTVTFHRCMQSARRAPPVAVLSHALLRRPEGLAFSDCGGFLAVGCHGSCTILIFARQGSAVPGVPALYGPDAMAVLRDASLVYPHGLAFVPGAKDLLVTNAGGNHASFYRNIGTSDAPDWSAAPAVIGPLLPEAAFLAVNAIAPMDGGPKGIAIHGNEAALCSPEFGVRVLRISA